jgi:hypothetical protein
MNNLRKRRTDAIAALAIAEVPVARRRTSS